MTRSQLKLIPLGIVGALMFALWSTEARTQNVETIICSGTEMNTYADVIVIGGTCTLDGAKSIRNSPCKRWRPTQDKKRRADHGQCSSEIHAGSKACVEGYGGVRRGKAGARRQLEDYGWF